MIQWAHQGGAREAPSNTLRALREAIERPDVPHLGLEVDVHLSGDRVPVVIHDATTDRTTGRPGTVEKMSVAELAALNAAARWRPGVVDDPAADGPPDGYVGGPNGDCRVPTLAEVLDLRRNLCCEAPVTIEVKAAAVGDHLVRLLQGRDELPAGDDVLVTLVAMRGHLLAEVVAAAAYVEPPLRFALAPTVGPLAWLWLRAVLGVPPASTRYARVQLPHQAIRVGGRRIVRNLQKTAVASHPGARQKRRLAVDVWTVDEPADMRRALRAGVDGIMTDRPTLLRDIAAEEAGVAP